MARRWTLLLIVLVGTLLRGLVLLKRGSFEFDEAFSTYFAALDFNGLWEHLKFENNPPGYFILLHFWMKLFGTSDLAARTLSMIFGVAAIPMVYVVGVKLYGVAIPPLRVRGGEEGLRDAHNPPQPSLTLREGSARAVGFFAAFLTAISTLPVFYSTEARMYALYLFLTLVVMWCYLTLEERRAKNLPTHKVRVGFFLACSFLVWTHVTAWMILLALAVYIFWKSRWNIRQCLSGHRNFFIILILLGVQLSPWLITFVPEKFGSSIAAGYLFYIPPDRNYFISILETFLVFGQHNAVIVTLISIVSAGLLFMAMKRPRSRSTWFLMSWLFVPLLIGFIFSNAVPRYFIGVAPAWYLLLGIGFARCLKDYPLKLQRTVLVIPAIFFALIFTAYTPLLKQVNRQWDDLAGWVYDQDSMTADSKAMVLINPHSEALPFKRYYRGDLPVVGFYPDNDSDSRDIRIVKTNWKNLVTKENVRALADVVAGFNQVVLILGETDRTYAPELLKQWFWENGWKRQGGEVFGPLEAITLTRESVYLVK